MDGEKNFEVDICGVCGESKFLLKEGFYYCDECGTKSERVVAVVVENDADFANAKYSKVQKIKEPNEEKPKLTSWECYNYILRRLVDQLLNLGAGAQLKTVAFQLWAGYLRKIEVAFFNKRKADIPRLSAKYLRRDASILYNHCLEKRSVQRKRKKTKKEPLSNIEKNREWRKNKRNLDKSEYDVFSDSQTELSQNLISSSELSNLSSSTGTTTRAIQLQFSSTARRQLKRIMQPSHIKKHQDDFTAELKCHKTKKLKYNELSVEVLSIRHLFIILIVALNLTQDDIQISDFIRFLAEEHISLSDPSIFFPANTAHNHKEMLKDIKFFHFQQYMSETLRLHATMFCKFLGVGKLIMPDISKLVDRYVIELCLPSEIIGFVKRLINLHPPEMRQSSNNFFCYEARIMAYILFALKLLFGLDDFKEKCISRSSREINVLLDSLRNNVNEELLEHLFVWDEWMKYIEMRKMIISQYHSETSRKYKQTQSVSYYLKQLTVQLESSLQSDCENTNKHKIAQPLRLLPSFTPCFSYMAEILEKKERFIAIPDFMTINHSVRKLEPFLNLKILHEKLATHNINIKKTKLACSRKNRFLGIFYPSFHLEKGIKKAFKNISQEDWVKSISESAYDNLHFKTNCDLYRDITSLKKKKKDKDANQWLEMFTFLQSNSKFGAKYYDNLVVKSTLETPRRTLDDNYFFQGLNDDTDEETDSDGVTFQKNLKKSKIVVSNLDYWILLGQVNNFSDLNKKHLEEKLPKSFFWLLELCAEIIEVDWIVLYEQLLVIEVMFTFGIEPLETFQKCIKYQGRNPIKNINILVNYFRNEW